MHKKISDNCFIVNKLHLIGHILYRNPDASNVRIHKTLYLLFAYYGASYGQLKEYNNSEVEYNYPKYLYPGTFEAWKYGPVDTTAQRMLKDESLMSDVDVIRPIKSSLPEEKDIIVFLDELIKQINEMSDFGLIDRVRQDESWRKSSKLKSKKMNKDAIVEEYLREYV